MASAYDERFFSSIRPGVRGSAEALVPLLAGQLRPDRVLDVGCGEGWWGAAFEREGAQALGIESAFVASQVAVIEHDLECELPAVGHFAIAVCLEVAEHLSPKRAPSFVAELCHLADVVVFSAAVPGQGGSGHLNEQWPRYWVDLFARHGYAGSGHLRALIWNDDRIEWWYRQNLLVFGADVEPDGCPAVIRPDAWTHHGHG